MLGFLFDILLMVLTIAGIFCTIIGMVTVTHWFKNAKKPADESNRISNISSWWIGLTRPDVLAKSYEYFQKDVMESIEDIEELKKLKKNSKE